MFEKGFLQDVRHDLWEILSGWGRRSRSKTTEFGRNIPQSGTCRLGNNFSNMLWSSQQLHGSPYSKRCMLPDSHYDFLFFQKWYFLKYHRACSVDCHFLFIPLIFPVPYIGGFHMCTRLLDHQLRTLCTYLGVCRYRFCDKCVSADCLLYTSPSPRD